MGEGRSSRFFGTFDHMNLSIKISIRTLSFNAKACFVLQKTFVMLSILFFYFKYISLHEGLASTHRFINKSLSCKQMCLDNRDNH